MESEFRETDWECLISEKIAGGDIVSPVIDLKISKCDACRCIQVTAECGRSLSAQVILMEGEWPSGYTTSIFAYY